MPVLYSRLLHGRLWYEPGFKGSGSNNVWPPLLSHIEKKRCLPILGPGLVDSLLGTRVEMARILAEAWNYPMSMESRKNLPQVSQYLTSIWDEVSFIEKMMDYSKNMIYKRFKDEISEIDKTQDLDKLISNIGRKRRNENVNEPHGFLAKQNIPVFITTTFNSLLEDALKEEGKEPRSEICHWNDRNKDFVSINKKDPDYEATVKEPLVYYLFGRICEPESLVITEDNYFDYLIGITKFNDDIPLVIKNYLANSSLLMLGHELDSWDFRVLYRSILNQEGAEKGRQLRNMAAQVNPEEDNIVEPEEARKYLEKYFGEKKIDVFWGTVYEFIHEFNKQQNNADT
jgi:hypothetical protein